MTLVTRTTARERLTKSAARSAAPYGEAGTKRMKREQAALSDIPRTPSLAQGLGEQATPSTFLGSSHLVAEGRRSRCKRSTNLLTLASMRTAQDPTMLGSPLGIPLPGTQVTSPNKP